MKFKTPYYANFNIPPCCAVCGDVPGQGLNWEVSGTRSNWNGKRTTSISLEVPLCQECYTVSRDKGLVKFLNVIGVLFAIGICFSFTFFLSTPSKSIGIAVLVTILWVVLYRWLSNTINVHGFTPEQRERRKHVMRCVKILSFATPSRSDKNGSVVFEFDSPHFALLFSILNSGELSALPDRGGSEPILPARKTPGQTPARLADVTAPVPGSVMEATPYPSGCVNCGVQRPGQNVVIYYGNKQAKSKHSYGDGKTTTVITTTTYTVGGSDEVSICDHCTKVRSLWRFFNVLWSVPLALGFGGFFVWFVVQLFSGGIHGGFNAANVVLVFALGLYGIVKTVDYLTCLVKPLNDTSRSALARGVVSSRHAGKCNTFWTRAEFEKLKLG